MLLNFPMCTYGNLSLPEPKESFHRWPVGLGCGDVAGVMVLEAFGYVGCESGIEVVCVPGAVQDVDVEERPVHGLAVALSVSVPSSGRPIPIRRRLT